MSEAARNADRVRYEFKNDINFIDLGLRLDDVEKWNLESESVCFRGDFGADSIATSEEQKFLRGNQRVELNAFMSADFIAWIRQFARMRRANIRRGSSSTILTMLRGPSPRLRGLKFVIGGILL